MEKDTSAAAGGNGSSAGFRLGDRVRILPRWTGLRGRVVELRGPLGPDGVEVYRVRVRRKPRPQDIEVLGEQLEAIPAGT
jgi:hypothetical protein